MRSAKGVLDSKMLTERQSNSILCADRLATEKPDILTGLPHIMIQETMTGDSIMKTIPLTQGKFAIVDDEDYEWLNQWKWQANKIGKVWYAIRAIWNVKEKKSNSALMHREVLKRHFGYLLIAGKDTDHINHNGLDNRKENLRICSRSQNNMNQMPHKSKWSQYKGVSWNKKARLWFARIKLNGKTQYLGYFKTEKEAAIKYNEYAEKLFREYAELNEIRTDKS